jgi:membrane-associated phospholipid phosphatase
MHHKARFNRMRPSSILPCLLPPLEVPGHAAYPSGHATQAQLIAMCLEIVMPRNRVMPASPAGPVGQFMPQYGPLRMMADRIARNREVAGLHYRSDTWAGRILAAGCFRIMLQLEAVRGNLAANNLQASTFPSVAYADPSPYTVSQAASVIDVYPDVLLYSALGEW